MDINFFLARKNVLLLIGGLSLFCIMLILFAVSLLRPQGSSPTSAPTPSQSFSEQRITPRPTFIYSKTYIDQAKKIQPTEAVLLKQGALITKFEDKLPYQGSYIFVYYTRSTNQVTANLDQAHLNEANAEFDTLLQKYNITSRSWFPSLVIGRR